MEEKEAPTQPQQGKADPHARETNCNQPQCRFARALISQPHLITAEHTDGGTVPFPRAQLQPVTLCWEQAPWTDPVEWEQDPQSHKSPFKWLLPPAMKLKPGLPSTLRLSQMLTNTYMSHSDKHLCTAYFKKLPAIIRNWEKEIFYVLSLPQ